MQHLRAGRLFGHGEWVFKPFLMYCSPSQNCPPPSCCFAPQRGKKYLLTALTEEKLFYHDCVQFYQSPVSSLNEGWRISPFNLCGLLIVQDYTVCWISVMHMALPSVGLPSFPFPSSLCQPPALSSLFPCWRGWHWVTPTPFLKGRWQLRELWDFLCSSWKNKCCCSLDSK